MALVQSFSRDGADKAAQLAHARYSCFTEPAIDKNKYLVSTPTVRLLGKPRLCSLGADGEHEVVFCFRQHFHGDR